MFRLPRREQKPSGGTNSGGNGVHIEFARQPATLLAVSSREENIFTSYANFFTYCWLFDVLNQISVMNQASAW